MKLIVQVPCLNEASTLPAVLAGIPASIPGITTIETLVIDDGSTDGTAEVARGLGVTHIVRLPHNRGLANAFRTGLDAALSQGADIIVNLDGDNQYPASLIPQLVTPVIIGEADIAIGNRNPERDRRNPPLKRALYRLGSMVMNRFCTTPVPDPVSGFRALSRAAAMEINICSEFSYTLEMIIQAQHKRLTIISVDIDTNDATRPSRLFRSIPQFLYYSSRTLLETYLLYRPLRFFSLLSLFFLVAGLLPVARFLVYYFTEGGAGHVQSLVLGGVSLLIGVALLVAGLLSHLVARNRILLEQLLRQVREGKYGR